MPQTQTPDAHPATIATLLAVAGFAAAPIPAASAEGGAASGWWWTQGHHECAACRAELARTAIAREARAAGFDPDTGRDTRNFPRHPVVDYRHMRLDLTVMDMNVPSIDAVQTLTVVPPAAPVAELALDAKLLEIHRVTVDGHLTTFAHEGGRLTLRFDPPLPAGEERDIVTTYTIADPPRGLYFTPEQPEWPGRPPQIHTQGQPEDNSYWFPCHDFPNERLTTEITTTVPAGFIVSANGRLAEYSREIKSIPNLIGSEDLTPYDTYRWVQDKPHVNYLVSLVVGKFDVEELGTPSLPVTVYAPPGRGGDARVTYARTGEMIRVFERLLDEPYPWDRYAQLIVHNFTAGGMENTSATTMYDTAVYSADDIEDFDLDGLISHELAHQWFGDLLTCHSWEHIWLNEGWATYMTPLWLEHRDGPIAYQAAIRALFDGVIAADTGAAPDTPGMASKVYDDPWDTFRRGANPYGKGASVLHMLRVLLGDEAFFRGVALYIDRHKFRTVETFEFRKALEDASGESLEKFFNQWVTRPNIPRVEVTLTWDEPTQTLRADARQTQRIDAHNPAFEFTLPIWVRESGGPSEGHTLSLVFDGKTASTTLGLYGPPIAVAFDPNLTVLCEVTCDHPATRSGALLRHGPTLASRVQAARAGEKAKADRMAGALREAVADNAEHEMVRVAAAETLAAAGHHPELEQLAGESFAAWEVREAVVRGMAACAVPAREPSEYTLERTFRVLQRRWESDGSTRVRAAALRGLASMRAVAAIPIILQAAGMDSADDTLRQAALDAMADFNRKQFLQPAIALTKPGVLSRTRPKAIETVVKLAAHSPDAAFGAIAPLISDHESRTRRAAGQALVDLADPRGVEVLQGLVDLAPDPADREQAQRWLDALRAKLTK